MYLGRLASNCRRDGGDLRMTGWRSILRRWRRGSRIVNCRMFWKRYGKICGRDDSVLAKRRGRSVHRGLLNPVVLGAGSCGSLRRFEVSDEFDADQEKFVSVFFAMGDAA